MRPGRFPHAILLAAMVTAAGCGRPPDKEIGEARAAIEAAQVEGADRYAADELAAAQDALTRAGDAVGVRDYQLALNYALDSRERARTAAQQTAERRAAARIAAERALSAADGQLTGARASLEAAPSRRPPAAVVAEAREATAAAERALQEARAAAEAGDWMAVTSALEPATGQLAEAMAALEAAITTPVSRRRR